MNTFTISPRTFSFPGKITRDDVVGMFYDDQADVIRFFNVENIPAA